MGIAMPSATSRCPHLYSVKTSKKKTSGAKTMYCTLSVRVKVCPPTTIYSKTNIAHAVLFCQEPCERVTGIDFAPSAKSWVRPD